jgi:hypothetical protein
MDEGRRPGWRPIAATAGVVGVLIVLAAILDIWPFNDGQLTREEFIAQGDEICRDAHDQYTDLQPSPPNTAEEATVLTGRLVSISEDEYNDILDLREPTSMEPDVARYLEARVEGIDLIKDAYQAAQDDDPRAYSRSLSTLARTQPDRRDLAEAVGFNECSRPIAALKAPGQS